MEIQMKNKTSICNLKDNVEKVFASKVTRNISKEALSKKLLKTHSCHFEPAEVGIFGKDISLQLFVADESDLDLLFFDDTIENSEFFNKDRNIRIKNQKI